MGREARCTVHHDGRTAEVKALLETDEVIVRSPFRLRIPLSEISLAVTEGEQLRLEFPGGPALLDLGEKEAARWAHAITHPRSLADKLGVKAGQRVLLVGGVSQELRGDGAEALDGEPADVVFVAIEQPGDLDLLQKLRARIAPDGAIWAVRPKGRPDLTEAMVMAAGRGAGLTDIKTTRISSTHTGEKFVIPRAER